MDYPGGKSRDVDAAYQLGYPVSHSQGDDGYQVARPASRRWRPVVAVLGTVATLGAIATTLIVNSGDSASTKATIGAPAPHTVVPRPSTVQSSPPNVEPTETSTAAPSPAAAPPLAAPNPRAIVYSVTGTKQLLDLVSVVYTDERGLPVTDFNVSLPWTKAIILNPGVQTESVIATSLYGHLNCSIVNAAGLPVVVSTPNARITTCTR